MNARQPGWYPDPFQRFAQRYHDGQDWTEHVADLQGTQLRDVAPLDSGAGAGSSAGGTTGTGGSGGPGGTPGSGAPPTVAAWQQPSSSSSWQAPSPSTATGQPNAGASAGSPSQTSWQSQSTSAWSATAGEGGPTAAASRGARDFLGPILAVLGALGVILGLFALDWLSLDDDGGTRSEVKDALDFVDDAGGSPNVLSTTFFSFGWIIGLVVTALAVVAALARPTALRIVAGVLAVVLALWALFGWLNFNAYLNNDANNAALGFNQDFSLSIGGWLTVIGFLLLAAGAFLGGRLIGGPKRSSSPSS